MTAITTSGRVQLAKTQAQRQVDARRGTGSARWRVPQELALLLGKAAKLGRDAESSSSAGRRTSSQFGHDLGGAGGVVAPRCRR
jgi:hypothetical protein